MSVGDSTLDLFLNEGPIAYVCCVVFATWLLASHDGLKRSVRLAAAMIFLASMLRCLPIVLTASQFRSNHHVVIIVIHISQVRFRSSPRV